MKLLQWISVFLEGVVKNNIFFCLGLPCLGLRQICLRTMRGDRFPVLNQYQWHQTSTGRIILGSISNLEETTLQPTA